jgi:hypothetical protein
MKIFTPIITIILCSLWTFAAIGADQESKSFPNMVGTWVSATTGHSIKGSRQLQTEIKITEQKGAHFKGIHAWWHQKKQEPVFHVRDKATAKGSEPILGIIGFDGKAIYIVEHGDWGVFHWRLVDSDTVQSVYVESGPRAVIGRQIFKRKK